MLGFIPLVVCLPLSVRSQTNLPTLSIATVIGYPGQSVTVPVRGVRLTNFAAMQFDVRYDSTHVTPGAVTKVSPLSDQIIRSREIAPGVRRVVLYSLVNRSLTFTNTGSLANLGFNVPATERNGSGPITFSNAAIARPNATALAPLALVPGTIFVEAVNILSDGKAQFFLSSQPDVKYLIQATTNLINWVNIGTNVAIGNYMDLVDEDAALYPYRFYRAVLFPTNDARLGGLSRLSTGIVSFDVRGTPGRTYVIQASTNLVNWVDISTNYSAGDVIAFTDVDSSKFPQRFYRAVLYDGASGGRIGALTRSPDGKATFEFGGITGRSYTIQASTNLVQWVNLGNGTVTNGLVNFNDTNASNFPFRFYRLQMSP
ncbi:MAG: cohesin domain-containing protein [Candidatus Hydrogenedentes bacterium]|nr:cohesin domain-containing protein [Candidatus Hydrogenedentota bacterium]